VKIEILGSGGAVCVPRPFCDCRVCTAARANPGPPHVRLGPSIYVHDLALLIDTPEEIGVELNRSAIARVNTALYTHWHPDHTAGVRVFEGNYPLGSLLNPALQPRQTRVILPKRVARTFEEHHALRSKLAFLEKFGLVRVEEVAEECQVDIEGWAVTPVPLAEEFAVGYLFEGERRVFICADESFCFDGAGLGSLDLAILPCGYFSHHPYDGDRIIAEGHPVLHREIPYEDTLDLIRRMDAARVVLVHLNHGLGLLPSEFDQLAEDLRDDPTLPPVEFAYDTMLITV
jgi:phosphoribosyl 1,2-cyclic phosphate phosphodiesterase